MTYRVQVGRRAEKMLRHRVHPDYAGRIRGAIDALADEPRPQGARPLQGTASDWRIRVGDYRVLYTIDDEAREVTVLRVGHRQGVYG